MLKTIHIEDIKKDPIFLKMVEMGLTPNIGSDSNRRYQEFGFYELVLTDFDEWKDWARFRDGFEACLNLIDNGNLYITQRD